jgi:hypothetical protein
MRGGFAIAVILVTSQTKDKFETPGNKKTPIVSIVDDTAATTVRPSRSVFPRSLEGLKSPGVKITEFDSTVDNEGL